MEADLFAIMFILVVLAVIYALVSGTRGRANKDDEEETSIIKKLLDIETDAERRRQTAAVASTLTDLIMIAMLMAIIAIVLIGITSVPT
ncbi:MAG: hypothetical protein N2204_07055 [Anaerolineae bacterium]|nr:hypothetical protein [Anaerolineae bacterium]